MFDNIFTNHPYKALTVIAGTLILVLYLSMSNHNNGIENYKEQIKERMNNIKGESSDDIYTQVILDAEQQYEIAKNGGDKTDIYVHAGLVAAAYLQAKDEVNYKKWKQIEKAHGKEIGL